MKEVLITGGDGVLASYIDFGTRLGRRDLDVTDHTAVMKACADRKPKVIIHCAALTDLALCEQHPDQAHLVNAVGTYHMACGARSIGALLVYISTSGVFDGTKKESYTEDDIPNPVNTYGHSKYLGELAVRGILDDFLIVRTSWIFGGGKDTDTKFVGKILQQREAPEVRAVADKRGSPTYAKDLAQALQKLVTEGTRGIVHLGGGEATRYDVAREALTLVGSRAQVVSATSGDFASAYRSGENERMRRSALMRPWQEALADYIKTEWRDTISVGS